MAYTYTNAQVTEIKVDGQVLINNITYDPFGAANRWSWGNGQVVNRAYDLDGQLDTYTLGLSNIDNNYTPVGNVQSITDLTTASNSQTFNYDNLHRLKDFTGAHGPEGYDYDASSNRSLVTDSALVTKDTYVTDLLSNQLSGVRGQALHLTLSNN